MKRNVTGFAVLAVGMAGLLAVAQTPTNPTRISDAAVAPPPTSFTALWVVTPTGKVLVQPDASIKIDLTANPPTIRAVVPPVMTAGAVEKVDQSVATAGQTAFALTAPPVAGTPVKVYKNGLLQWQSADYSLVGQVVTFLPAQGISPGDYVQIIYWK
jgi:hypothetical protein